MYPSDDMDSKNESLQKTKKKVTPKPLLNFKATNPSEQSRTKVQ